MKKKKPALKKKPATKRKRKQLPLFKRGSIPRKKPKKPSFPAKVIQEESLNGDE